MHIVVAAELATPIDAEAAALAKDLGTTAYEERLKLVGGLPAVIISSAAAGPSLSLNDKMRARGHRSFAVPAEDVVPSDVMIAPKRFALEPDALVSADDPSLRLPYADVLGIFRAMHSTRTELHTETKEKKFSMGRALVTGGIVMSKTTTKGHTSVSNEREQLLYLFRASGQTPWCFWERGTNYGGLGKEMLPSSAQSFLALIGKLRQLAPQAVYDERLLTPRGAPNRPVRVGGGGDAVSSSSGGGVDLLAHVIALTIAEKRGLSF